MRGHSNIKFQLFCNRPQLHVIVFTNGYLPINHECCFNVKNFNNFFIQQRINNNHKSQLSLCSISFILYSHVSAVSTIHHQAKQSNLKKKMIEFNTIRYTALKLTVKGGRITVMECYIRSVYLCYILVVDLKTRDTRKITTCQ